MATPSQAHSSHIEKANAYRSPERNHQPRNAFIMNGKEVQRISAGLVLFIILAGCAGPPRRSRPSVAFPARDPKIPLTCALIADASLCAPNAQILGWGSFLTTMSVASGVSTRSNLSSCVFTNALRLMNGSFQQAPIITPEDNAVTSDLFAVARVVSTTAKSGITAFSKGTFTLELEMVFLDNRRVPVMEIAGIGSAQSAVGGVTENYGLRAMHRAFAAIEEAMAGIATDLPSHDGFRFLIENIEFFARPDSEKAARVGSLFSQLTVAQREILGPCLLAYASKGGYQQLQASLLSLGVPPNQVSGRDGRSPLHDAAQFNNAEGVERLLAAGANVQARDKQGRTPLFFAAWLGNWEAAGKLLDADAPPDVAEQNAPVASAALLERCGDYYASRWRRDRAASCYGLAASEMAKAVKEYDAAAKQQARVRFWNYLLAGALSGLQSGLADISAQRSAEQTVQLAALRAANDTGTGMPGYYYYLHAVEQRLPAGGDIHRIGARVYEDLAQISPIGDTGDRLPKELKREAEAQLRRIEKKAKALDTAADYSEFKRACSE